MNRKIRSIHWGEIPFFFITLPLGLSICIAYFYPQNAFSIPWLIGLCIVPVITFIIPISPFHFSYSIRNSVAPIISLTAVFLIWNLSQQSWRKLAPKIGERHHLTIIDVKKKSSFAQFDDGEKIFLRTSQFQAGDRVVVLGSLRRIRPNPTSDTSSFDFYTYATRRNIRYSLKPTRMKHVGRAPWYFLSLHALRWRDQMGHSLTHGSRFGGWVKAILFGDDREIEGDALTIFKQTGTLHVLAVSGMHVSVLFTLVDAILKFLPGFRRWPWIRFSIGNITLWMYALISGFSPSIARSAWMFSLGSLGRLIHREGIAINHLFAAAFFILIHEPTHLFHLGFQLSFIAVGSILLFEPIFSHWMSWNSWMGEKIGAAMGVTTAAQIGTAPLGIFYFQSFPTWFLPANLLAVPISSLLLLLYLFLLVLHPLLPKRLLIWLIDQPIHFFTRLMQNFETLPWSNLTLNFTWEQVWVYLFTLVLLRTWMVHPFTKVKWLILMVCLLIFLWPNFR